MDSKTLKSIRNFILLILVAWFVKTTILEIYVVPTGSMFDTIEQNDLVIGNKFIYGLRTPNWIGIPFSRSGSYIPHYRFSDFKKVENGDITVFEFPYDDMHKYVKRTIGLPKQYVEIKQGKISIGESLDSVVYREDLTYPEKSRIKKEISSLKDDPRPTEKEFPTFQHNKYSELFSYYSPIYRDKKQYIDRDNMKFQVPFKGMRIDFTHEETDLYSALMILLLDGYDVSFKGYSVDSLGSIYNADNARIEYNKLEASKSYQFHKFDNEQMFDTSMTIWGFVKNMPTFIVLSIVLLIVWKLYLLGKDMMRNSKDRFKVGNISQLALYLCVLFFIIYLGNVDIQAMRDSRSSELVNAVNSDLLENKVSLKDFFQYKIDNEKDAFFNNKVHSLNLEYQSYKNNVNLSINQLIKDYVLEQGVVPPEIDCESIYNMDVNKTVGPKEITAYQLLYTIFDGEKTPKSLRNDVGDIMVDYYNYKNMYDYNVNSQINKKLKQELFDYILINGIPVSEKSDYVLQHNYYFMVGDNRNGSSDSRSWGFVPDYNLLGQPVITLVNFGKFKLKFDVHL